MLVPFKPFQPSLMFEGKSGAYPIGVPFSCSTLRWALGLSRNHWTRLEKLARNKHYSLFGPFVIQKEKRFKTLALGCGLS
jgi:hypothetical protein